MTRSRRGLLKKKTRTHLSVATFEIHSLIVIAFIEIGKPFKLQISYLLPRHSIQNRLLLMLLLTLFTKSQSQITKMILYFASFCFWFVIFKFELIFLFLILIDKAD